jgi:hypothetical protein
MLMIAILSAIVSATFWLLSKSNDAKKIWAVVCLATVAMACFILIAPLG